MQNKKDKDNVPMKYIHKSECVYSGDIRMACSDCCQEGTKKAIGISAARRGHLSCLIWALRSQNASEQWDIFTCRWAAENGHLDCLMWVRKNGDSHFARTPPTMVPLRAPSPMMVPGDEWICPNAAKNGHLDCLIWARKNGYQWDDNTCAHAAYNGHLSCLIWARRSRAPWTEHTCAYAANNGHLQCLMWARRNGCPWNEKTCFYATEYRYKDVLKWIHKNGSPCDCMKERYEVWNGWKKDEDCAICLERLDESTVKFCGCVHRYHKKCMDNMLEMRKNVKKKGCSICNRGK